ncbi:hypothetical protein EBR78_04975 [bacterium]|nr:hypothetical protein [bacterium]
MNSKKAVLILGLVVVVGISWWFTRLKLDASSQENAGNEEQLQENRERMATWYQAPREPIAGKAAVGTPECIEFWNKVRALDLNRQQEEFPDISGLQSLQPCKEVPAPLKNLNDHYQKVCHAQKDSNQCLVALYYYRAALTDYMTRDVALSSIQDPKVLIDKMLANREVDPALSVKAAERLSELEPQLYEARKAQVLGRLFMATQQKAGSADSLWREVEITIEKAKQLNESDPELLEAQMLAALLKGTDARGAEELAKEIAEDYPQEWRGPYYAAWALFKEGRGQEALDFLSEAQRRDPQNVRIREALEGIKKGDAAPFKGDISFSDLSQYF